MHLSFLVIIAKEGLLMLVHFWRLAAPDISSEAVFRNRESSGGNSFYQGSRFEYLVYHENFDLNVYVEL